MNEATVLLDLKVLRNALVQLVGVDTTEELHTMAAYLKDVIPDSEADKPGILNAIEVLLNTQQYKEGDN